MDGTLEKFNIYIKNCKMIHRGCVSENYGHNIGIGAQGEQNIFVENCEFEFVSDTTNFDGKGVFWHNWNNQEKSARFEMRNCKSINTGIFACNELGSEQEDIVIIENCTTNLENSGISIGVDPYAYKLPDGTIPNNADFVPYNIKLFVNSPISFLNVADRRKNDSYVLEGVYDTIAKNSGTGTITYGKPIVLDYSNPKVKSVKAATGDTLDGICFRTAVSGERTSYVPRGKTANVILPIGSYTTGDLIYLNGGVFAKTGTNPIGICLETRELASPSYVKVKLL